jgi:Fe-S cluster biosynthesis and repair protein YggX
VADTNVQSRLEQFKKMAEADPDNELGHFSLGRAYLDAGLYPDAAASLQRCLQLNPNLSKAYQLLADAQLKSNQRDAAVQTLTKGAAVASDRGDLMPKNAMLDMLRDLGAPVPELKGKSEAAPQVGEGQVQCSRCSRVMPKMAQPPFSNAQGKMIQDRVCAECWREWIGMGTKVINEMRLPLADPQAQKIFDQHMMEFLNLK